MYEKRKRLKIILHTTERSFHIIIRGTDLFIQTASFFVHRETLNQTELMFFFWQVSSVTVCVRSFFGTLDLKSFGHARSNS